MLSVTAPPPFQNLTCLTDKLFMKTHENVEGLSYLYAFLPLLVILSRMNGVVYVCYRPSYWAPCPPRETILCEALPPLLRYQVPSVEDAIVCSIQKWSQITARINSIWCIYTIYTVLYVVFYEIYTPMSVGEIVIFGSSHYLKTTQNRPRGGGKTDYSD